MKNLQVFFAIMTVSLVIGCNSFNQGNNPASASSNSELSAAQKSYLVNLGFTESKLQERENDFVYDGDMVIDKSSIPVSSSGPKKTQRAWTYVLTAARASHIRVMIDPSVSAFTSNITSAINSWNNTQSSLSFTVVTTAPDLIIYSDMAANCPQGFRNLAQNPDGSGQGGRAAVPANATTPGSILSLNIDLLPLHNQTSRNAIIIHELGHCFGLMHTDDPSSALITGTPANDASSIMNSELASLTLDNWDITAVRTLFPRIHNRGDRLNPGEILFAGQLGTYTDDMLVSQNGRYKLVMQSDGNLVSYNTATNKVGFRTNTNGKPVQRAIMQVDGNFVLYGANNNVYWYSCNSPLYAWSFLIMQNDGNVVMYTPSGSVRWASMTLNY